MVAEQSSAAKRTADFGAEQLNADKRKAAVAVMLDAQSVALVGASPRPGSFGHRMVTQVLASRPTLRTHLVNPRYDQIKGRACSPSVAALDEPVDLVLLGIPDRSVEAALTEAAAAGARSAVLFGSAFGASSDGAEPLRDRIGAIATGAGMALCGAGCMGFVNVAKNLRAIGYEEPLDIPAGPIALITHSGSVFSALLRTRRALGYCLAVSSGQELVTSTADYLHYVLDHAAETGTRIVALLAETVRDVPNLTAALRRAAETEIAVVMLPVGGSPVGAAMVAAHSGAVAGSDAMWEALCESTGVLRVRDLAELSDTLELLALNRIRPGQAMPARAVPTRAAQGIATVHDSGAERTLVVDLAHELRVRFADLSADTNQRLTALMPDGLQVANPLDLWGTGADTRGLFAAAMQALAADDQVAIVALGVDLVTEYDGDTDYPDAVLDAAGAIDKPLAVLTNLASAIDEPTAQRLRAGGVAVLEGTRSGLAAMGQLLAFQSRHDEVAVPRIDGARQERWLARLGNGQPFSAEESFHLIADYGVPVVATASVTGERQAVDAARAIGFPVVLKTDMPGIAHKSDVGGVLLGIADSDLTARAYRQLAARFGSKVTVAAHVAPGPELSMGLISDERLGPLLVLAAGGVLVELLADRVVARGPLTRARAAGLIGRLKMRPLLDGWRGQPPVDVEAVVDAILCVDQLGYELGSVLSALEINPLVIGPTGVLALDVLVIPRE